SGAGAPSFRTLCGRVGVTYSAELSLFRRPSSYDHSVSGYPYFSAAAAFTSSSGPPLSSVYFLRTHDFTRPPRLVNTILKTSFSMTVSDSVAACAGADEALAARAPFAATLCAAAGGLDVAA